MGGADEARGRVTREQSGGDRGRGGENQRMHNGRLRAGAAERLVLRLQFFDVGQQLLFVRHAAHVETEHFVRAKGWLSPGPQRDQQARNDRGRCETEVGMFRTSLWSPGQKGKGTFSILFGTQIAYCHGWRG